MREPSGRRPPGTPRAYSADRLVSYSDAIFSIAVTLLAIDIKLPEAGCLGILAELVSAWPSVAAFLVSFFIITVVWFNHHEMFHHIRMVDQRILVVNILLMLNIVLIPLASSILARSFMASGIEASLGAFLYGMWIAVGGLPFNALWRHALRSPHLLRADVDIDLARKLRTRYAFGPCLYAAAAAASFACAWVAIGMYVLLLIAYFIPASVSRMSRVRDVAH